jgi:HAE1 family hydrophobic/amphiphilic exporter-1
MNFSATFIKRPIATFLCMLTIAFFGCISYLRMPVSDLPSIDYPAITINVNYPGADPKTIATTVLSPLEKRFSSIEGLQTMASSSSVGAGIIVLQFSLNKTLDSAAIDVQAAITAATPQLPRDLPYAPTYSKVNPSSSPALYLVTVSSTLTRSDLYAYSNTYLAQRLNTIEGVAQVITYGSPYAVRLQLDPQKLAAKGIGFEEVAAAAQSNSVNLPTGNLYGDLREYTIETDGQLKNAEAYNSIVIKNKDGALVRIQDVGEALNSLSNDRLSMQYLDAKQATNCIVLALQIQPNANTMAVIDRVNTILPSLEASLPKSIEVFRSFDKSEFIGDAIEDVQTTLWIAFILVVVVIFLYLGKLLNTLIPVVTLPITVLGTFIIASLLGYSIDILSLLAITLAIGFLVDDAIVVLENIVRHIEQGKTPIQASLDGSQQIGFTILSMTLSLCSVFIPLIFMPGIVGRLFNEFAVIIVVAMIISGLISLSLTPMLCSYFLKAKSQITHSRDFEYYSHRFHKMLLYTYTKSLGRVLKYRKSTLLAGLTSILMSFIVFKILPSDFLPSDDVGHLQIFTQAIDETSPLQMAKYHNKIIPILRENRFVDSALSITSTSTDNSGMLFVKLTDAKKRPSMRSIILDLEKQFAQFEDLHAFFKPVALIDMQVSTSSIHAAYQYTLQGLDTDVLYETAQVLFKKMRKLNSISSVNIDLELSKPQARLKILREKAAMLRVDPKAIEQTLSLAFASINIAPINGIEDEYYAILELRKAFNHDLSLLSQLHVKSLDQKLIPLTSLVIIDETVGPIRINRIDGIPAVNISFNTDNASLGSVIKEIEALSNTTLPDSVQGHLHGTAEIFQSTFSSILFLFCITFFLIYIILGILYENFLHPITVMSTLPPALLGGLLTLLLFKQALTLYAFVGLILLLGIVMKNGIILVDFANELKLCGKSSVEAITEACIERLRPILMTTLCSIIGAIPIALGIGGTIAQGRISLGIVIVGGLLFSQVVTLFLTPTIYLCLEQFNDKIKNLNLKNRMTN